MLYAIIGKKHVPVVVLLIVISLPAVLNTLSLPISQLLKLDDIVHNHNHFDTANFDQWYAVTTFTKLWLLHQNTTLYFFQINEPKMMKPLLCSVGIVTHEVSDYRTSQGFKSKGKWQLAICELPLFLKNLAYFSILRHNKLSGQIQRLTESSTTLFFI